MAKGENKSLAQDLVSSPLKNPFLASCNFNGHYTLIIRYVHNYYSMNNNYLISFNFISDAKFGETSLTTEYNLNMNLN
jgi:hypothetical protein